MRVFIDADGCPVVDITIAAALKNDCECIIICDTSHVFERAGATTITVSKGADSADFALVNRINSGDIVVTQDYGLAAMCLARGGIPVNQDGMVYTSGNIDALLASRYVAKKIRNSGGRIKGPKKREEWQNEAFTQQIDILLKKGRNANECT